LRAQTRDEAGRIDNIIMTSAEVAEFLKVHLGSVRRWSRTGKLRGYRLGERGDWRYLREDVLAFFYDYNRLRSEGGDALACGNDDQAQDD
jgi:excisionase family DNA binding protein